MYIYCRTKILYDLKGIYGVYWIVRLDIYLLLDESAVQSVSSDSWCQLQRGKTVYLKPFHSVYLNLSIVKNHIISVYCKSKSLNYIWKTSCLKILFIYGRCRCHGCLHKNISTGFRKHPKLPQWDTQGLGGNWIMKKLEAENLVTDSL